MVRIALGLEYAGEDFAGWQCQPDVMTVQKVLERALEKVAVEPVRTYCAGRTDAGVHATMQVVHFDTCATRPATAWVRGVNSHLPCPVAVRWAQSVDETFHARFSALERHYRYILFNAPHRPGLLAGKVGWFHLPLEEELMREAAAYLLGEHDFSAFRSANCQAKNPVRQMRSLEINREGAFLVFDFGANAFLHHMIRNIVGALVYVGKRRYRPEWLKEILESRNRTLNAPTFAPDGLYLCGVRYDPKWLLPGNGSIIALPRLSLN